MFNKLKGEYSIFIFWFFLGFVLHFSSLLQRLPAFDYILEVGLRLALGLPLSLVGLFFVVRARRSLAGAGGRLVTGGVYAFSRNPFILGTLVAMVGLGIFFQVFWWLFLSLPAFFSAKYLLILPEEELLRESHGDVYGAYCERVNRLL